MSPHIPEGAKKLLKDIGVFKRRRVIELFPKEAGYTKVNKRNFQTDLKNAADLIEKMLFWDPNKRISAEKSLEHKFFEGLTFDD